MAGQGLDRIPLRIPDRWDPAWFETFVRDVLAQADVRNAIEGAGISITGQSDEMATLAASADVLELLEAGLLTAEDSDLDNARQLVAGDGSIELVDGGPADSLAIAVAQHGILLDHITQIPALSVLASQNATDPATLEVVHAAANDRLLRRVSDAIDFGQLTIGMIPDALVTFAKLQNADALSVLGRGSNTAGVLDELIAGTDHHVLRRSGTAVAFGSLDLSQAGTVGSSRLALANIAQITGQAVLGVASAGSGNLAAISAGTNDRVLSQTSGVLSFTQLTAGMFPNTVVPDAALSTNVPLKNATNAFTVAASGLDYAIFLTSATPGLAFNETDAAADNRLWDVLVSGEAMIWRAKTDAGTSALPWLTVERTGTTIDSVLLGGKDLTVGHSAVLGATANRGTIAINGVNDAIVALYTAGTTRRAYFYHDGSNLTIAADTGGLFFEAGAVRAVITSDGRLYGTGLHNNAGAVTGTTNQYIASGTYTPTLTNVANLDASTVYQAQWMRVGNVVTVSGRVDVDPTAAGNTQLGISLPIASDLAANEDCAGVAFARNIAGQGASVNGDVTNNRAQMQWVAVDTTSQGMWYTFTYEVL